MLSEWGGVHLGVLPREGTVARAEALLSERERVFLGELPAHRREEWCLGREACKRVVASLVGLGEEGLARVEVLPGSRGEPRLGGLEALPPLAVSLSHARGLAVAAVAPGEARVGVDVAPAADIPARLWHFFLTPAERARCEREPRRATWLWLLKEALYKALCPESPLPLRAFEPELSEGVLYLRRPVERCFRFSLFQLRQEHLLALVTP